MMGDIFGGLASMLVALPSAIAFGMVIYGTIGSEFASSGALVGMIGTMVIGMVAAMTGGTARLISAPCAPAAALLAVFVGEAMAGGVDAQMVPICLLLVGLMAGIFQIVIGTLGGGRLIKYIPYPVVAGYLSGVGVLIFLAQLPKFLGMPKGVALMKGLAEIGIWKWECVAIGLASILAMSFGDRLTKKVPASIMALVAGVATYFLIAMIRPAMFSLEGNNLVIGQLGGGDIDYLGMLAKQWQGLAGFEPSVLGLLVVPALTLATLLSVDTLKTCVVLDAMTKSRHNSNRELIGQGLGNLASALCGGMPGAGTMGPTLVNLSSGAMSRYSGVFMGFFSLLVLLLIGGLVAWIPIASLAGILIVVAYRMVDRKMFALVKRKSTILDFLVIISVVVAAVTLSLIAASAVGIAMSVMLFLRDHINSSVIRHRAFGDKSFSKKIRIAPELEVLEKKGSQTLILELHGHLFFGTADQLLSEVEPWFRKVRTMIIDMKGVERVDFSAVHMLHQIEARIIDGGGRLIFTALPGERQSGQNVSQYMETLGFSSGDKRTLIFADLDEALEWTEDEIIKNSGIERYGEDVELELSGIELFKDVSDDSRSQFRPYMKEKTVATGKTIFKQGDPGEEIYFIRRGTIKIELPLSGGRAHHLSSFGRGDFFGDLSFMDQRHRSASARASSDASLFVLSRGDFDRMMTTHPRAASVFFERLSYMLAGRLRRTNIELQASQDY